MRFNLSMENFRCFASVKPVRIAPITLLVGENSSGKTSFLAALRQVVEAFTRTGGSNGFNREPYYLGSFEQIAHYRGGRSGRARSFCLGVDLGDDGQEELFSTGRRHPRANHVLTFTKGSRQPEVSRYSVQTRNLDATFDFTGTRPRITIRRVGEDDIQIDPRSAPPSALLRREVAFLGYYLQELVGRTKSGEAEAGEDAPQVAIRTLVGAIRASSRTMAREVFASAPVRIQPRRVYIPSELTSFNAGEQVPLEMANLKLTSPDAWQATKERLNAFGRRSGLFDDIEVKRLGKTDSDPFQLQIKNQGPASNIVDVGYGVSQALPLLYLSNLTTTMIFTCFNSLKSTCIRVRRLSLDL